MHRILLACLIAFASATAAIAQADAPVSQAQDAADVRDLDSVVVRGVQPGPGLWKVSKGDHVLWILGTLAPLPRDFTWNSHHVEAVIAASQEVIPAPEAKLKSTAGLFANLAAVPLLIGVRNNPDGKKLSDVVPADVYARWLPLKQKYIGRNDTVESWRPLFAAQKLYDDAIRKIGLTAKLVVENAVLSAARRERVKIVAPKVDVTVDSPRAAVKEFKSSALADGDCFSKTIKRIDSDLATMTARANAWATGDVDALRKLPYDDQMTACHAALSQSGLSQTHGLVGISARARQVWIDAATSALERNKVTFAMLSIDRLLTSDPYLSRLRALGYTVEEPASKAPASKLQGAVETKSAY